MEKVLFNKIRCIFIFKSHEKSSHCMLQLEKMLNLWLLYWTSATVWCDDFSFLPHPVLGENGQYMDFLGLLHRKWYKQLLNTPLILPLYWYINMTHFIIKHDFFSKLWTFTFLNALYVTSILQVMYCYLFGLGTCT